MCLQLNRTKSVPDLTAYIHSTNRYKPQWPIYASYRSYWPHRFSRDYGLVSLLVNETFQISQFQYDTYRWYDRYYHFSPLYYTSMYNPRRYYYNEYMPKPLYWVDIWKQGCLSGGVQELQVQVQPYTSTYSTNWKYRYV